MNPNELAEKFFAKVETAKSEKDRQRGVADEKRGERLDDVQHCKRAMADCVIPFFTELKSCFPPEQFSFSPQIDMDDHAVIGVSFRIGDGPVTTIGTAFGNVVVTHSGAAGSMKGVNFVYPPDSEPYISNSGDLTREKMGRLVQMEIDNVY